MTGDFLGSCEAAKSCIKDGLDLVLACSVCSVFKIRETTEKIWFFDEGRIFNKKNVCLLKNSCIY